MTWGKYTFLFIIIVYLALYFTKAIYLGKTVYGDGVYYYAWMRSLIVDRDINFDNDYAMLGGAQPSTPDGRIGNVYPIGPPLLWSPFFVFVHQILKGDGFSFTYQIFTGLIACLYAIAGLVLLYRLLASSVQPHIAIFTIYGIAFGTNMFFYGSLDTITSHSISFFLSVVALTFSLQGSSSFLLGASLGLLASTRTQDIIYMLLALPILIRQRSIQTLIRLGLGWFLGFAPELFAWQLLYGTILKSPYLDDYHYFDWFHPHLLDTLLSSNNGLFFWTPLVAFCLLGLILKRKWLFLLIFLLQWYLISSWSFWWQGASFSGRMFISFLPLASFGLASFLQQFNKTVQLLFIGYFSIHTTIAILFYLLHT